MTDPVSVGQEGHVFERTAIAKWFQIRDTNPVTNTRLGSKNLTPCIPVQKRIQEFREAVTRLGGADKLPAAATPWPLSLALVAPYPSAPRAFGAPVTEGSAISRSFPWAAPIRTRREALKQLRNCRGDARSYTAVLETYVQSEYCSIDAKYRRAEPNSSECPGTPPSTRERRPVAEYKHVMHKLERLSGRLLADNPQARCAWEASLKPVRRQVYESLCRERYLVRFFAHEDRMQMPELDGLDHRSNDSEWVYDSVRSVSATGALSDAAVGSLQQVKTVFLVDDRFSMERSGHSGWTVDPADSEIRWGRMRRLLAQVAPLVAEFDPKGVDIHFMNSGVNVTGVQCGEQIVELFSRVEPPGEPCLTKPMQYFLDAYMSALCYDRGLKPLNLVVFTDNPKEPWSIQASLAEMIRSGCTPHQLSVGFVRVSSASA
ncbi:U box domain containing protein [Klebsormidium nitens]|uniref:U box domain containing protein n=1 Tax=Klebsormidium nitens TaxID=105231 RepID=A0A1Y1HU52_KLENI|nr:U box domain containing protein [Klebsormidium nitens]|eukprot:GAQ82160.1 U box domain containing protein [Klebsormidium nitens]